MILPDEVDPEREILSGVKNISRCQVRNALRERTYYLRGWWMECGRKEIKKADKYESVFSIG